MATEDRTEQAILHPAHIEFLILRIAWCRAWALGVVRCTEETANVGIEVRTACHGVVKSGRHLLAQHIPCRGHVARPEARAVVLLSGKGRTCHDEYSLVGRHLALVGIDALDGGKWEEVANTTP